MDLNVFTFLQKYQIAKGSEHTHTSFIKPTGAFYLPISIQDEFMEVYKRSFKKGEELYVTEKHRDQSPVLIDLDFRYEKQDPIKRHHTYEDIKIIIQTYLTVLDKYVSIPEDVEIFVMEKPAPVLDKTLVKDGIHIVIPDIVTTPLLQHMVRSDVLKSLPSKLSHLPLVNPWEDIIDEAVIQKNNWMMYGSRKPNSAPYKITYIFSRDLEEYEIEDDHSVYVDVLSIRNKFDISPTKAYFDEMKAKYDEQQANKFKKKLANNSIFQTHQNNKKNTVTDIEYIKKLVAILSPDRADNYQKWIRLGWCLRNIDHRLLETWVEFSKRSSKFQDGECEKMWNYMKDDGLNVGSLHLWAKEDNINAYREIVKQDLSELVRKSTNGTHTDIAQVVYFMYKYDYVCVSIKNNYWYEFRNHKWQPCDSGHTLRSKISNEVCQEYNRQASAWSLRAASESDDERQKQYSETAKKLLEICLKLKITSFKDNIVKECKEVFYIEKFEEKLDSRPHLIGFENGVFDLIAYEFREGRPEDYISFSTGINYVPYTDDENAKAMHAFFERVFPKPHMKEYFLLLLSSFLNGAIKEEKFHIFTGGGCFAKDTKIMMFDGSDKNVQDVQVGDRLMGDDSTPRTVQQLFRGYSDMYEIIPVKGDSFVVNGQHDLVVKATNMFFVKKMGNNYCCQWVEHNTEKVLITKTQQFKTRKEALDALEEKKVDSSTVKLNDIIILTVHQYLNLPKHIQRCLVVYRPETVKLDHKEVKLDPWILGYWLGDGNTTEDPEVVEAYQKYCEANNKGVAKTYGISGITHSLNSYQLFKNKHIPDDYKFNSEEIRMQLLAGIIDSDGHYQQKMKHYEITLKSETLIDDIMWIARSLGFACYKSKIKKTCTNTGKVGVYFQTILVGKRQHEIPVKVPRKQAEKMTCHRDPLKLSFKVKRVQDDNFYGFELDGNRRFCLGDGDFLIVKNSNGKSKCIDLFEQSFGEYCCKLPITLLTQKRAASNAATSELARTKGKRFACLQEPSEDEKLNVGLMKELTGGDKIMARQIYKEPVEFKPQFKMVLTCNQLPNVPANDNGTWRRLRVIEFTSKFCENPNPENPNEFEMDMDLSSKFEIWKEYFMGLLIEYYKKYVDQGITEPDEVTACTREYQRNNDVYLDFVEQEFERNDMAFTSYNQMANCFKSWLKDNNMSHISIKKRDVQSNFLKTLGKTVSFSGVEGYKGWQFKSHASNIQDELEN